MANPRAQRDPSLRGFPYGGLPPELPPEPPAPGRGEDGRSGGFPGEELPWLSAGPAALMLESGKLRPSCGSGQCPAVVSRLFLTDRMTLGESLPCSVPRWLLPCPRAAGEEPEPRSTPSIPGAIPRALGVRWGAPCRGRTMGETLAPQLRCPSEHSVLAGFK